MAARAGSLGDFQARVDESVQRILTLKYRLYPEFSVASASPDLEHAQQIVGKGTAEIVRMARESATLLSPQSSDRLPAPPVPGEEIVLVLKGVLQVCIEDNAHELHEGDCITFDARLPHLYRNEGVKKAVWVYVGVPPTL